MFGGRENGQANSGAFSGDGEHGLRRRDRDDAAPEPTILVIDDDPSFCEMIGEFLQDEGYRLGYCYHEQDACAMILRDRPKLVLLDLHLGVRGSGLTLLQSLRRNPAMTSITFIVISADSQYLRDHSGLLRGYGADLLEKPFDLMDLLGKIDDALSQHVPASSPKPIP